MTYPQQPGQHDPWGQQNPYAPSGGQFPAGAEQQWGQQYGSNPYAQPGGQYPVSGQQPAWGGQPGGQYPPSGPHQAWPQQGWGQPGYQQYPGQQFPYGQPTGPTGGGRSKLPWILGGIGGGVVLIGAVVLLIIAFTGGGRSPQELAERYTELAQQQFAAPEQPLSDEFSSLVCSEKQSEFVKSLEDMREETENMTSQQLEQLKKVRVELVDVTHQDDTGEFTMKLSLDGQNQDPFRNTIRMKKESGEWKACGNAGDSMG
ncbi:Rv0361 family membrane protein [Actinopolyspora mortivallis]|uniref:DUF4878 domain-containing protein n=1 Tax=Actinopolyspora mortivallis TaxID=33906 RepID=A0A2T0H1P8_ACTMO|nr:hypothetical protein [Actinopolyspora mortivallis]PRW65299.1 hypothetical protein CEP50_01940 [Actinopolyspora mortivallis]